MKSSYRATGRLPLAARIYGGAGAGPQNGVAPGLFGTPEIGQTLTCDPGTWTGTGAIAYAYQWLRGGAAIPGATATAYTLAALDDGAEISTRVTATDEAGTRSMTTGSLLARYAAPLAAGALADRGFTENLAIAPVDLSVDFTGENLAFGLSPSSDALPEGLALSAAGVLSGTPLAEATRGIVVRASNSGGLADSGFTLTVGAGAVAPPAFGPSGWALADAGTGGAVQVTITAPPPGAEEIEYRLDGGAWMAAGSGGGFVIGGLTDGVEYAVDLRAANAAGVSPASDVKRVTPSAMGAVASTALVEARVTSATDMLMFGIYWLRPYDLAAMEAPGAAVMAANGGRRYVWFGSSDHFNPGNNNHQHDGYGVIRGFSDDPGILPETFARVFTEQFLTGLIDGVHRQPETPWLVYNPEDPAAPFYLYWHGNTWADGTRGQESILFKSANLVDWTFVAITDATTANGGHRGYKTVYRRGPGDWISWGLQGLNNGGTHGYTTSADGVTWSDPTVIDRTFDFQGTLHRYSPHSGIEIEMGGQMYHPTIIEPEATRDVQRLVLLPVDAERKATPTAGDDLITLYGPLDKAYPWPESYIQSVHGYTEDGVAHLYVQRGYFEDQVSLRTPPEAVETELDRFAYVFDPAAAAQAAPVAVRASCVSGVVTVRCDDVLPNATYRLERAASATGPWTLVADSGPAISDNAAVPGALNWYRMTTLEGGTPRGSRIVSCYAAASADARVARHMTRLARRGFDLSTVDAGWIAAVLKLLDSHGLTAHLLRWTSPAFGVKFSGGTSVSEVGDLVSTLRTRWGTDARAWEGAATQGAYSTAGMAAGIPAIVGGANGVNYAPGFGRYNHIRQKAALTMGAVVNYDAANADAYFLAYENRTFSTPKLVRSSGAGTVSMAVHNTEASAPAPVGDAFLLGAAVQSGNLWLSVNGGARVTASGANLKDSLRGLPHGEDRDGGAWGIGAQINRNAGFPDTLERNGAARGRFTWSDIFAFGVELTPTQADALNTLIQGRLNGVAERAIRADYGAAGDGTTDDSAPFEAFATEFDGAQAPVILNVEAGTYNIVSLNGRRFVSGVPNATVIGAEPSGGTWPTKFLTNVRAGGGGQSDSNERSVRLAAVPAGANTVTVLPEDVANAGRTLADLVALFPVGRYVAVTAFDLQGFGFPSNQQLCEIRRVTAADAATGVVTLDTPLAYAYPDDAPLYNAGGGGGVDLGGPATMYALSDNYDRFVEFQNVEWLPGTNTYMAGRSLAFIDCKTDDIGPGNAVDILIDGGQHRKFEMDKLTETITIRNATIDAFHIQSPSPNLLLVEDSTLRLMDGTARVSTYRRNTITQRLKIGPIAYGVGGPATVTDNALLGAWDMVTRIYSLSGAQVTGGTIRGLKLGLNGKTADPLVGETLTGATSGATATITEVDRNTVHLDVATASGTFQTGEAVSTPSMSAAVSSNRFGREWCVPGALLCFRTAQGFATAATVTAFRAGAGRSDVNTIETDVAGFPAYALPFADVFPHPCTSLTASGNTGSDLAASLNAHAPGAPVGTAVKLWMGADGLLHGGGEAYGKVVSYAVNVTRPYTGTRPGLYFTLQQFSNLRGVRVADGSADPGFDPRVDLRQAGLRTWHQDGNSGQVGGDDTAEDCGLFLGRFIAPDANMGLVAGPSGGPIVDISGEDPATWPLFEITLTLDPYWRP